MQIMAEKQQDLAQLEQTVERCLDKRLAELRVPAQSQAQGLGTLELELKHQRELMQQGFELMDKRFETVDKRFEELRFDMKQGFEMLIASMDKCFELMDKRSEELRSDMNQRFVFMQWMMAAGFGLMGLMMSLYKFFPRQLYLAPTRCPAMKRPSVGTCLTSCEAK